LTMTKIELQDRLEELIVDADIELSKKDRNRFVDALTELFDELGVDLDEDEEDE